MKQYIVLSIFLFALFSCKPSTNSVDNTPVNTVEEAPQKAANTRTLRDTFDCQVYGKVDKTSDKWIPEEEFYFAMTNNIFQNVQPEIMRYSVFQVYNTITCELRYNGKLPNKENLIRPYRLHGDVYNSTTRMVCAQNAEEIFCFDMELGEILNPLYPPIAARKRGKIEKDQPYDLHAEENFLFGWTKSEGAFAFDMTSPNNPLVYNYTTTSTFDNNINYYFLLQKQGGKQLYRCLIQNDNIVLSKVFDQPLALSKQVIREKAGGNYLILKYLDKNDFVAVDLSKNKLVKLPNKARASTLAMKEYLSNL